MIKNNAFWREVIDYLPNLILVFRVDEQEEAHLIFCNNNITEYLGYAPKEYVLASETGSEVKDELKDLIDEVARRSHDVDDISARPCTLTTKFGEQRHFGVDFRLFKTKAAQTSLIAVELKELHDVAEEQVAPQVSDAGENHKPKTGAKSTGSFFVAESDVMKTVLHNVERLLDQPDQNIMLRGEPGTGKRTLARMIIETLEERGAQAIILNKDDLEDPEHAREKLHAVANQEYDIAVGLWGIDTIDVEIQSELSSVLNKRKDQELTTRVISTSTKSLEELVEAGKFDAELFYALSFSPVLLPPLRHRKADLGKIVDTYLERSSRFLNMKVPDLAEEDYQKIMEEKWEGNLPDLFDVLRNSLLKSDEDEFNLRLEPEQQFQLFPEETISEDEIIAFDDMNRRYLSRILKLTDGKIYGDDGAAALLDLKPTTLQSKLKRLGLK